MNCACEKHPWHKRYAVDTCGLHHWREEAARLRGMHQVLAHLRLSGADCERIIRELMPSQDYIDSFVEEVVAK